jgi:homoserine dehydrogenase
LRAFIPEGTAVSTARVGLIGLGTVGSGVAKLLRERRAEIRERTGMDLDLVCAADTRRERAKALKLPARVFTTDAKALLAREDLDIVIELIGGLEPARAFIRAALAKGRSVVTANKHLLAESYRELTGAAAAHGAALFFEASVAGGIPLLKSIREGLAANRVLGFQGIVNGTCNYILTQMAGTGMDFKVALAEAQAHGYAEAVPALDIEGHDSAHKLVVLSALCFDRVFRLADAHVEGITGVSAEDIRYAAEMGYVVKLVAAGRRTDGGFDLRVHPTLLPKAHPLASVSGVFNAVLVEADAAGRLMFYGRGAGQMPTASAVVADVIDAARWRELPAASHARGTGRLEAGRVLPMAETRSRFYIRFTVADHFGVLGRIATELGRHKVSIEVVHQKERRPDGAVPVVMLTHPAREADFRRAIARLDNLEFSRHRASFLRVGSD